MMAAPPSIFNFWNPFSSSSKPAQENDKSAPAAETTVPKGYSFKSGVFLKPHDDKVYKGGEDAYCTVDTLIAVADGVGGWANRGVDPGLFSK